jgi:hypothetical protein
MLSGVLCCIPSTAIKRVVGLKKIPDTLYKYLLTSSKFTLKQAMKVKKGSRGIALIFL